MRVKNYLRGLAIAATVAAVAAPAANATDIGEGGGGFPPTEQHVVGASHHPGSADWTLIALAGGGTVALIGAGLGGSCQVTRRRAAARQLQPQRVA
jgi:hypothetical protein